MNGDPTYDELIAANIQLQQKVEWLENAYRSDHGEGKKIKSRFLSNVTHEIRTPMNAIMGFSGLLQNEKLTQTEKEEYLYYISHNSQALLKVMDNIIDLTLLETQNLRINQEAVSIQDLITEVYDYHNMEMTRIAGKRMAILMSMPNANNRIYVNADSYRLRRVMDNLVGFALKHQKKGVVELKLEIPNNNRVVFSVGFEGNTLLIERAKKIFEKNGSDDDWENQLDNTGVACKLARDLTEAMDGTVCLDSSDEMKTEIKISLPMLSIEQEMSGAKMQKKDVGEIPVYNSN
jgi:K+-sensing histidine kinase KdpD